jgi:hypothetical protein
MNNVVYMQKPHHPMKSKARLTYRKDLPIANLPKQSAQLGMRRGEVTSPAQKADIRKGM